MNVLVISAHPDDEALGCAGTILKHRRLGDELFWMIVTEPHSPRWSVDVIDAKAGEVERAAEAYGMSRFFKLGFPTTRLDEVCQGDLIQAIYEVVADVHPELVYTVHEGDIHTDHKAVYTATMSAIKAFSTPRTGVRRLLSFETLSSTDAAPQSANRQFAANVFSDITPFIDQKLEIMQLFETERQDDPLPRGPSAMRALARFRGATVGVQYAEAFMLIRECW